MKTNKIVIVGGGSSGWMTAAALIKAFPNKEITLVESPDIQTIGVGESTFEGIKYFCNFLEIDEKDFLYKTDGSYKLAIEFRDFYNNSEENFYFPFGNPYLEGTRFGLNDWLIKKYLYPNIDYKDFAESYFPVMHLINNNTFDENFDGKFDNYNSKVNSAYHFDAGKFGLWLKESYCIPRGVKLLVGNVSDAFVSDIGIDFLIIDNEKIYADLFIDCTGFKSLLLEKYLGEDFTDYSEILPNNKAWATQIEYIDKELELKSVTSCTAIENGWIWNIPLWSRIGTGYVYSDRFISSEDALAEFKRYLSSGKYELPRTKEYLDSITYKEINIKTGIHKNSFVKNVVAIGLSAAFIEPLESNGLYTVHQFLFQLIRTLLREEITQWDRDSYNITVKDLFDDLAEFVSMHYSLSIRNDTEYWKNVSSRKYFGKIRDNKKSGFNQMVENKTKFFYSPTSGGFTWISAGMNYPMLDSVSIKLGEIESGEDYRETMREYFNLLDYRKNKWNSFAKSAPSLKKFMEENIYKDQL